MLSFAQTAGFSYQSVVRNAAGELIKNKDILNPVDEVKG